VDAPLFSTVVYGEILRPSLPDGLKTAAAPVRLIPGCKLSAHKTCSIVVALLCALLTSASASCAQSDTGRIEGFVRDAQKRPVAQAKVCLDDQLQGRTDSASTDSAGHFLFATAGASTYMLRAQKTGYRETSQGPILVKRGETTSVNLQLTEDAAGAAEKSTAQAMEYSDDPKFTVAGVSDPSDVGGHGSNVTLPTKEALAKDTASLSTETPEANDPGHTKIFAGELPKVSLNDFAENLKVGQALLQVNRPKDAVPYLAKAVELQPQDFDAGYALALAYLKSGDLKRADASAQSLLAGNDRAEAHALLAVVKEAEGQPVEAVKQHQRAAEMDPSEAHLFSWGAELLLHHAYEPAAEVFAKGHRDYPKSIRILVGMGAAAYAQDLNDQAARWLLQASAIDPSDPRPYVFLGKVQEVAKSEPDEWVAAFQRFATLQPENAQAHYFYAVALAKQRRGPADFAAREAQLNSALALDPKFGGAYLELGLLQSEKREYATAVASLQKAVEFTPLPDQAHLRLAQVYRDMGEAEKARKESELYNEVSAKKKEQLAQERKALGQFVYTMQDENGKGQGTKP
jgi:Tfp pilus assembly protein PilF